MDRRAQLAEDLVNTYDQMLAKPEWLGTVADLMRFLDRHGIDPGDTLSEDDLEAVRALRGRLRTVFEAGDALTAAAQLNDLLADLRVQPRLGAGDRHAWRLDCAAAPDASLVERLTLDTAAGLAVALEQFGKDRLRVCAAAPCRDVFIDTSRNATRRYCGNRCANRLNIAAHRARRRLAEPGG